MQNVVFLILYHDYHHNINHRMKSLICNVANISGNVKYALNWKQTQLLLTCEI